MKTCSKCGVEKKIDCFSNRKNRKGENLRHSICKDCLSAKMKAYYENNKERLRGINANWRIINKDRKKEMDSCYQKDNREKINARLKGKWPFYHSKYKEKNRLPNSLRQRKYKKEIVVNLRTIYIKELLKKKGFSNESIIQNPELVETYRVLIKTKRLCQKLQTSKS